MNFIANAQHHPILQLGLIYLITHINQNNKIVIKFDNNYPDGMARKVMDINKITKLGWSSKIELKVGLEQAYKWFSDNYTNIKIK